MTVWENMIGQPHAVDVLTKAALEGRSIVEGSLQARQALSHAWLITGPPGSGRSIAARCLAAGLQCTGEPIGCGVCRGCRTTMAGTNADVQVYATDLVIISVDEAKEWLRYATSSPTNGRWRVTVVEDADRMHDRAANMLLKSIEESPERALWVLCAPTPSEVLPTIRSRCRALALRTPKTKDVAEYLAVAEGAPVEDALQAAAIAQSHVGFARAILRNPNLRKDYREVFSLPLKARSVGQAVLCAGRMHDALLEMSKKQTERIDAKEREEMLTALGVAEGARIPPSLRGRIREMEEDQKRRARRALADAIDRALTDLLAFYRDVLTVQLQANVDVVNVDMEDEIHRSAASTTAQATMERVRAVELARVRNRTTVAPLLLLEGLAVALVDPATPH